MDARLEKIFEAWYDYEHAGDEDAKIYHREQRAKLVQDSVRVLPTFYSVGDFLHRYRDAFREWAIKRNLRSPRKRF